MKFDRVSLFYWKPLEPGQSGYETVEEEPPRITHIVASRRHMDGRLEKKIFGLWAHSLLFGVVDSRGEPRDRVELWCSGEDNIHPEPEDSFVQPAYTISQNEHYIKYGTTDIESYPDFIRQ